MSDDVLQVVCLGASCLPVLAQYVKNQNALEHRDKFPRAAKTTSPRYYEDDMLDSVDTVKEAIRLAQEVWEVYKPDNLLIRRWICKCQKL